MGRRPPPPFLVGVVAGRDWLTSRLVRVTLRGDDLRGLEVTQPASSVRVLIPGAEDPDRLDIPTWDGNRFVGADGARPTLRTLTPRFHDRRAGLLRLDVVVHGAGAAARWAADAPTGSPVGVSGPARGYDLERGVTTLVLGGDETALAAMSQIIEAAPADVAVRAVIEAPRTGADPPLPDHPRMEVTRVEPDGRGPARALVDALGPVALEGEARLWAAGEAAAMQQLRTRLVADRGLPRERLTIRGYWKHGRVSEEGDPGR